MSQISWRCTNPGFRSALKSVQHVPPPPTPTPQYYTHKIICKCESQTCVFVSAPVWRIRHLCVCACVCVQSLTMLCRPCAIPAAAIWRRDSFCFSLGCCRNAAVNQSRGRRAHKLSALSAVKYRERCSPPSPNHPPPSPACHTHEEE